jgi:hypothetical protein
MIATKIIFSDPSVTFDNLFEASNYFLDANSNIDEILMQHAVELITNQQWIENKQTFTFDNAHTVGIVNYSADQAKADLFAASLTFWQDSVPSTTTVTIEQTQVDAVPTHAVPILHNDGFYLDPQNIDLDPEVVDYFLQSR